MSSTPSNHGDGQIRYKYRPATIAELASQAQRHLWDPSKPLKHWLRTAERARKAAQTYQEAGDYESAFVEFAKAATLVLEKLPTHSEYKALLTPEQRSNLGVNGQDILDSLSKLKPLLVQRYEDWQAQASTSRTASGESMETRDEANQRKREEAQRALEQERARHAIEATRREQEWKREESIRRPTEDIDPRRVDPWGRPAGEPARRRDEAAAAAEARQARERADYEHDRRRREDEARRQQQLNEDEERLKRRVEEKRRQEQDGIARRQQEAENAARAARREITQGISPSPAPLQAHPSLRRAERRDNAEGVPRSSSEVTMPVAVAAPFPSRPTTSNQNPTFADPYAPPIMPLESPRYDYDTESESTIRDVPWNRKQHPEQTPTKARLLNPLAFPPPITTTSPAPPELAEAPAPDSSLLFDAKGPRPNDLYSNILPPKPSAAAVMPYAPSMPMPDNRQYQPYPPQPHPHHNAIPSRPPIPPKESILPPQAQPPARIIPGSSRDANIQELKSVRLPRECLHKFVTIARVNTLQNRETCGLLLGKDRGNKYVITTLLIPKQRATSDTCTMDEEELVLSFTEERSLITLGWIHTHPTQSCFMSSVDLHTHSGFQRMLPESFAVVCAPSSTPSFGIFRLTDPGGLQTILKCNAKEAFHPHPDVPIYTDCDNSHVQMKDMPLEIVDLRG
ncbi:peptidase M67C family protein [Abortiporus biennis]